MNKIKIKHGENEIELEGADKFIKLQLEKFYDNIKKVFSPMPPSSIKKELVAEQPKESNEISLSPAEYYKKKGRTDGISKLLIFAKYLELYEGKTEFTPSDINEVVKKAKLSKDIHRQYFTNAVKQGLLRSLNSGRYSLTLSAEEVLASM